MKPYANAALLLTTILGLAPALAQEPVVAAADPEALFTDPDPRLHANKQVVLHVAAMDGGVPQ